MISAIVNFIRSRFSPPPPVMQDLPGEDVPEPRVREFGGPYRSAEAEPFYNREAHDWDIISLHGHQTLLVYVWTGCRESIDYRCNHHGEPGDCKPESLMLSSNLVDTHGSIMNEDEAIEAYGQSGDGTIIRTMSGTVYRLCGKRGYHEPWSPGSIFREAD